jgi:hypothetical protein
MLRTPVKLVSYLTAGVRDFANIGHAPVSIVAGATALKLFLEATLVCPFSW